jgi:hypothetical protein
MPFRTVLSEASKWMKSALSFDMQLEAPESIQTALPPGLKFINMDED